MSKKVKEIMLDGAALPIKEFDMNKLIYNNEGGYVNPRIVMIAKSGSGKSWVVRDIIYYLYHKSNIPAGLIVAPTDRTNKFYDEHFPRLFIRHEWKPYIFPRLFQRQKLIQKKNEKRKKQGRKQKDNRVLFIMDDCMSCKKEWIKDPYMLSIMNEGRHYGITYILTMQYSLGMEPELRTQFDYIFLLGDDNFSNRKKLYEHYAGVFPTKDLSDQVFAQLTDDYGCMVIDNRVRSTDLTKKVFYFKAKKREHFVVGGKKFKKYNEIHFDPDHEDREDNFDMSLLIKKRRGPKVAVKKMH